MTKITTKKLKVKDWQLIEGLSSNSAFNEFEYTLTFSLPKPITKTSVIKMCKALNLERHPNY